MPDGPEPARACIARLQTRLDEHLAPLIGEWPVALVDYPDHANVGDSAIWLGETAWLRDRGLTPAYVSTIRVHDHDALAAAVPEGPILLHGGGNFGTLWQAHQDFRLAMLERFPGRPIIQLPQSIFFDDEAAVAGCARAIERHGRFTLCVRDEPSLEFARRHFPCETLLVPDMAFAIGPLARQPAAADIFCLLRTDHEQAGFRKSRLGPPRAITGDWLKDDRNALRRTAIGTRLLSLMDSPDAARARRYERQAWSRVRRGIAQLSQGRVVITDRLHGHILSTLLAIPHVALDNSYRKIGNFIDAWTGRLDILRTAASLDEAATAAAGLLGEARRAA
jgi:pyruvyl transferase EpsO